MFMLANVNYSRASNLWQSAFASTSYDFMVIWQKLFSWDYKYNQIISEKYMFGKDYYQ